MAVKVFVSFETQEAQEQLDELQDSAAAGFKELGKVAQEGLKLEKLKGAIDGVKRVVDKLPEGFAGITKAEKETVKTTIEFADGGLKVGAAFGPLGAIIGGLAGGALGLLASAWQRDKQAADDAAEAMRRAAAATRDAQIAAEAYHAIRRDVIRDLAKLDAPEGRDIATVAVELTAAREAMRSAGEDLRDLNTQFGVNDGLLKSLQKDYDTAKAQVAALESEYGGLATKVTKATDAHKKEAEALEKLSAAARVLGQDLLDLIDAAGGRDARIKSLVDATVSEMQREQDEADKKRQAEAEQIRRFEDFRFEITADTERRLKAIRDEAAEASKKKLEETAASYQKALQPLAGVVGGIFAQITKNVEAGNKALAGVGKATRAAIGAELKELAKSWGAKALAELAAGLASLAVGNLPGASNHFASSAGYGAAAAAAGVAGAVVSRGTGGSSASSPPPAGADTGGGLNPALGGGSPGRAGGGTVIVNLVGNMFLDGDDRALAPAGHKIARALQASSRDRFGRLAA